MAYWHMLTYKCRPLHPLFLFILLVMTRRVVDVQIVLFNIVDNGAGGGIVLRVYDGGIDELLVDDTSFWMSCGMRKIL
jgi:hypothetical protein